jgi:hypothetical protein
VRCVTLCVLSYCSTAATGYKPICSLNNNNNNNNNNNPVTYFSRDGRDIRPLSLGHISHPFQALDVVFFRFLGSPYVKKLRSAYEATTGCASIRQKWQYILGRGRAAEEYAYGKVATDATGARAGSA